MKFLAKSMSVEAEQFLLTRELPANIIEVSPLFKQRQFSFGTKEHHVSIRPGDWIINDSFIMPDSLFKRLFTHDNV